MITKYIKELLFEHECVVLPGFGGFLTQYVSADIHPISHKMQPPSKRVAFNAQLKNDDGLLVNAIATGEILAKVEASRIVDEYVDSLNHKLATSRYFEMKDVGRFFLNKDEQVEFEPDPSTNYLEESFSLPELIFKPIERKAMSMNTQQKSQKATFARKPDNSEYKDVNEAPVKKSNSKLILIPAFMLLIAGGLTYMYFNQDNQSLASVNPFVMFAHKEEVAKDEPVIPKAEEPTASEVVTEETTTEPIAENNEIIANTGRFYIVAGSFKSRENAEKFQKKLLKKNMYSTILESQEGGFYRVSIAETDSKKAAKSKLTKLKGSYGKNIWILSI